MTTYQSYKYVKFSPSGNTTLFLIADAAHMASVRVLKDAMGPEGVAAEQAGVADCRASRLEMAGGEFCANACRAMGALLDMEASPSETRAERYYEMTISGYSGVVRLAVKGKCPDWHVCAKFKADGARFQLDGALFEMPGISHKLVKKEEWPDDTEIPALADAHFPVIKRNNPAFGVAWWRKNGKKYEILPYVRVPSANTAMVEGSCGSATMALAMLLAAQGETGPFHVSQPSGQELVCDFRAGEGLFTLGGSVRLCSSGLLWLPGNKD